jgi:hypothetical protein
MIKVAAPNIALKIIDNAIGVGGAGVSGDEGRLRLHAHLRLADGPEGP